MALTGKVSRWINRKGYGFINVVNSDSEHFGNDLFVHLSGINIPDNQYKSLYPGEYVSFDLTTGKDGRLNCVNLTGVLGGPLLIENPEYKYKVYPKNRRMDNLNDAIEPPNDDNNDNDDNDAVEPDDDNDDDNQ